MSRPLTVMLVTAEASSGDALGAALARALKKRLRELERVLGKKTMENEILREAVKIAHEKQLISHLPLLPDEDTP